MKYCLVFISFVLSVFVRLHSQENYDGIPLQGQIIGASEGEIDLECMILSASEDTLWRASHTDVAISEKGMFQLYIGNGTYISGDYLEFNEIDWKNADRFELYRLSGSRLLIGDYSITAVPYAFEAKNVDEIPTLSELSDTPEDEADETNTFSFNGTQFIWSEDILYDTDIAYYADSVDYADTVWVAIHDDYADSAMFTMASDSVIHAEYMTDVTTSDTAIYADSAAIGHYSTGNWALAGNEGLVDTNFIGTLTPDAFTIRTNNFARFVITDSSVHNNFPGSGFRNLSNRGFLVTPNMSPAPTLFESSYLYYDGEHHLFHAGTSDLSVDTLQGPYSFAFGENVGTNGSYSTVFGKNTYGDTAYFGAGTPYAARSSFAMGRNCHVTHMGVAIGDSAIAGYYRNVAIGRNVIATEASSGIALGYNVLVTGATSWAAGRNLTADGHFSTAMGSNASSGDNNGSFIYGDFSTTDTVDNTSANQFMVRAAGGYIFYSHVDLSMGVELLPGAGSWSMISDRTKKNNITLLQPIQYRSVFDSLTIYTWNYVGISTAHIGPMAQDFYSLFGAGEKPYLINMIDSDGVTMLGIKMIKESLDDMDIEDTEDTIEEDLENEQEALDRLEERINTLYEELDNN